MTPDNNHFEALLELERSHLIQKHASSTANYPIYIADRVLMSRGYLAELREMFGLGFDALDPLSKQVLGIVYRFNHFSKLKVVSAKQASYSIWYESNGPTGGIEQFDSFYRRVRYAFNKLQEREYIHKKVQTRGYLLNEEYLKTHLL